MDKYELNIKVEQLKKLAKSKDYKTAMKIADSIDWRRVHNSSLLSLVSEIYENVNDYSEAKEILLLAFERVPVGKHLLYRLTTLALKEGNIAEAEAYYNEFNELAPEDSRAYLLRYLIMKEKGAPLEQLITTLEAYNGIEINEKWMYELAELYHDAGRSEECIKTCDSIMLMFGFGEYVENAMALKTEGEGVPLSEYQQSLIENKDQLEERFNESAEDDDILPKTALYDRHEDVLEPKSDDYRSEAVQSEETSEPDNSAENSYDDLNGASYNNDTQPEKESQVNNSDFNEDETDAYMRELEERERLKREISDIKNDGKAETFEAEKTKVLDDIKSVISIEEQPEENVKRDIAEQENNIRNATASAAAQAEYGTAPVEGAGANGYLNSFESYTDMRNDTAVDASASNAANESPSNPSNNEANSMGVDLIELDDFDELLNISMIEAKDPEEGLNTAISRIKKAHVRTGKKNQVIKIKAQKLNEKGVFASFERIGDKDLIVEEAGDLSKKSIEDLLDILKDFPDELNIVFIDNHLQIEMLIDEYPDFAKLCGIDPQAYIKRNQDIREARDGESEMPQNQDMVQNAAPEENTVKLANEGVYAAREQTVDNAPVAGNEDVYTSGQQESEYIDSYAEASAEVYENNFGLDSKIPHGDLNADNYEDMPAAGGFSGQASQMPQEMYQEPPKKNIFGDDIVQEGVPANSPDYDSQGYDNMYNDNMDYGSAGYTDEGYASQGYEQNGYDAQYQGEPAYDEAGYNQNMDEGYNQGYNESMEMQDGGMRDDAYETEELSTEAFSEYASQYATAIDCVISGKSMNALIERAEMLEADGMALTRKNAEALIEAVADKAEKPPLTKRLFGIFSPKYNKDGFLILKEEHFLS